MCPGGARRGVFGWRRTVKGWTAIRDRTGRRPTGGWTYGCNGLQAIPVIALARAANHIRAILAIDNQSRGRLRTKAIEDLNDHIDKSDVLAGALVSLVNDVAVGFIPSPRLL